MANPPNKNVITAPPSLAHLKSTLTSLTTASSILQGFAHRNKNQHRGTRWWGAFGMLSRNIRKLLPDLEDAVRRAELLLPRPSSAKRSKTGNDGNVVSVRQPELDKFVEKAQWVHDIAVVKAYEAFTQLTADKQFAQLGLVLIGVLAQVEAAITPFVQDVAVTSNVAVIKPANGVGQSEGPLPGVASSLGADFSHYDLGVSVARDELDECEDGGADLLVKQSTSQLKKRKKTPLSKEREQARKVSEDRDHKRVKASKEDILNLSTDKKKTEVAETKKSSKLTKKKKGKDEFDDLFSSLM